MVAQSYKLLTLAGGIVAQSYKQAYPFKAGWRLTSHRLLQLAAKVASSATHCRASARALDALLLQQVLKFGL